jgi:ubiquinone/menaquinone biosynthesis C-methylase UbiE
MKTILAGVSTRQEFEERGVQDATNLKRFLTPELIVMDLGCGIGRVDRYLASSCKALYGVDVSDRMLAIARKRLDGIPNVVLHRNNGRDLSDFSNGMFDFVFALLVMHHLDKTDAKTYLKEIHRVLKIGGTFYVQFPNRFSKEFREKGLRIRKYDVSRVRWYTEPESRANLEEAGFKIQSTALDGPQIIQICAKSVEVPNVSEKPVLMITA